MSLRAAALLSPLALALLAAPSPARAADNFVVLTDDGSIEASAFDTVIAEVLVQNKVLELYAAAGQPLPEILSVWTTFPLGGAPYGTVFDPIAADVKGIGLENDFPPDGTKPSAHPPLRSILFHNDVTQLAARASLQRAPLDGFGRYLFLLELSHNWGPQLHAPAGSDPFQAVDFPYHWSFFMDCGGSPAGGNKWQDNGDGTFTTVTADPKTIAYSMLDLYLMGLATTAEVPDFGVLEGPVVPATPADPLFGGTFAAHSFPWFDASGSLTVTATRRSVSMAEVVTANGVRDPAAGSGPASRTLGIVLLVSKDESAAVVELERASFADLAVTLAPAFHDATAGRGTLEVVTSSDLGAGGGGGAGGGSSAAGAGGGSASTGPASAGAGGGAGETAGTGGDSGCGCATPGSAPGSLGAIGVAAAFAAWSSAYRRRARPSRSR